MVLFYESVNVEILRFYVSVHIVRMNTLCLRIARLVSFIGVCVADEVQTGFGRFGKHFWGPLSSGNDACTMWLP